ncbi:DEAD/DEAH box helicase [Halostagnicola kamekurae]|uniref:DEAD/DEAH box helicase domain-containing protein n=1 Tax=Halostagnicola kamekurae TaxID=619731 RepID=A0A1I6QVI7_9EURY|nr:DEAD/DEAH box helicase [Halostagnicola kamekurae]SFS56547.1 DEAD/DEAH box helicase domain-containing protein [Halostagnicola kamekurae]
MTNSTRRTDETRIDGAVTGDDVRETFPRYRDSADATVLERPGRDPETVPNDDLLRPELAAPLENDCYTHQAEALEALERGENVCVATSTSSGKTRIYALQIARNYLEAQSEPTGSEPTDSTAYVLYPTKALSRDQERELNDFYDQLGLDITVRVYDGDTERGTERRQIREEADVIISNFAGVNTYLHDHDRWARFFSACDLVVIDESHTYTGVHGMHVAWILRRLRRVLEYYGSEPQFALTSATIGNPREHSETLVDEPVTVVDEDGSPRGPRDIVLWNPPPRAREDETDGPEDSADVDAVPDTDDASDSESGVLERVPATVEAPKLLSHLAYHDAQTLLFTPSRKLAELSVKRASKHRTDRSRYYADPERGSAIEPYHAGHSRPKRHGTEHQLKNGLLDGVASTNALELGINVGEIDATVQMGYPGQRQSFWQQIGRAGRGTDRALSVLVAEHRTLDQYVVSNPEFLLESDVEDAVADVENDAVFAQHLLCAADELAIAEEDVGSFADRGRLERGLEMWRRAGKVTGALETGVSYCGPPRPQSTISLYATRGEEYEVRLAADVDEAHDPEMEPLARERVYRDFHEGAVRLHEGRQYEVTEVVHSGPTPHVTVRPTDVDYYTVTRSDVTVLDAVSEESRDVGDFTLHYGRGRVLVYHGTYDEVGVHGGKRRAQGVPTDNPPLSMETQLCWLEVPRRTERQLVEKYRDFAVPGLDSELADSPHLGYAAGLHAAEHATIGVAPLELMVDKRDLGGLATLTIDSHLDPEAADDRSVSTSEVAHAGASIDDEPKNLAAAQATVRATAARLEETPSSGWFIYDGIEGGLGFSRSIYENFERIARRAREHIADCECGRIDGCPACVMDEQCGNDNQPLHRGAAIDVLDRLLDAAGDSSESPDHAGSGEAVESGAGSDERDDQRRPPLFFA